MVEKIDRPDARSPYTISQAKETKEDRHQQHNPRDDAERERKKRLEQKEWQKFGRRTVVIKPLRVERDRIAKCLFRAVNLHSGIGTLRADIVWIDGKSTQGVVMLVKRLEDFLELKKLAPGQEVPERLWVRGHSVEMGIPHVISEAGALSGHEIKARQEPGERRQAGGRDRGWLARTGVIDRGTGRVNWGLVFMYAFVVVLAAAAVAALIAG